MLETSLYGKELVVRNWLFSIYDGINEVNNKITEISLR